MTSGTARETRDQLGRLHLRMPARPDVLPRIRADARSWLSAVGVDPLTAFDLVLAIDEACANAIEHPVGRRSHSMEVEGTLERRELVVSVRDDGTWRNPHAPGDRGRGLPLMRVLVDDVQVHRSAGGTELRLRRRVV